MVCKSFHCEICDRAIPCRGRSLQSCIRKHYWKHHRSKMMRGARKRRK